LKALRKMKMTEQTKALRKHLHQDIVLERMGAFVALLREENFLCDTSSMLDAVRVAHADYLPHRLHLRQGLRACLCHSREEWRRFDPLFDYFWSSVKEAEDSDNVGSTANKPLSEEASRQRLVGFSASSDEQELDRNITGAGDFKTLSLADFRFVFDKDQMQHIEELIDKLAKQLRRQRRRRTQVSKSRGRLDLRRSQQRALATGGALRELAYRRPIRRLPSFVLLLDISQSMEVYAKLFLRFTRQLMSEFDRSSAYAFNTQIFPLAPANSRLTEEDFERALNTYGKGWLGGTRIADSLHEFNTNLGRRAVSAQTTVVIFSDGYDTAKPDALLPEVQTLQRRARKLIWVNPLLGRFKPNEPDPNIDPLKPYLDIYCSGHNLAALSQLGNYLSR